ncbi:MAG TPA: hypothetical protein VE987_02495 [Polyangiaceae bacterium]|nr:hypothetical protein [Polyangiaceae bacterium]
MDLSRRLLAYALALVAACAPPPRIVPLVRAAGLPVAAPIPRSTPLEVVSRSTAVPDPLPVRGSDIVYGDVETALGVAVSSATAPWAETERDNPVALRGGWTVLVEVIAADAELEAGGRVVVGFEVRATLRTRRGNVYLGQTQLGCREGGLVAAEEGAPVVYRCMIRVGRDLAGWLAGGVRLDPESG